MTTAPPSPTGPVELEQQCLVGHVFTSADQAGLDRIGELWVLARHTWPLASPGPAGLPSDVPATLPTTDGPIALAEDSPGAPGLHQAVLYRLRDRLCLAVSVSPPGGRWEDLLRDWQGVAGSGHPAELGSASVLTAVADRPLGRTAAPPGLRAALTAALPAADAHTEPVRTADGLLLLEAGVRVGPARCLAVVAPPGGEDTLDHWTWSDGTAALAPLGRYLLHAAGAARLVRDSTERQARAERAAAGAEAVLNDLLALLARPPGPDLVPDGRLLLVAVRTGLLDLVTLRTRLTQDARDAEITAHNLTLTLTNGPTRSPGPAPSRRRRAVRADGISPAEGSPLVTDLTACARLAERVTDLCGWLASVEERAQYAMAAAETAVAEQIRLAADRAAARQERTARRNAALVGSLVMLLAAIQSLAYRVPLPGRVVPAVIALVAALALLLAAAAPTAPLRDDGPQSALGSGGRTERFPFTVPAAALTGAALAWCVEGVAGWALHAACSPRRTLAAALLAACCSAVIAHRRTRIRRTGS